jgi:hypothetical protein
MFLEKRRVDRRQTPRKRAAVKVYLSWPGQPPCRCWATDLSMTGAFVKVGAVRIPEDRVIKLVFVLTVGSVIKIHRRSATVVHRSEKGLGMMFQG